MAYCGYNDCYGYGSGLCGTNTSCVSQAPSSEMCIKPPSYKVYFAGPIMCAGSEPIGVWQNNPCSYYGCGLGGYSGYGGWSSRYSCGYGYPSWSCGYPRGWSYGSCGW